MPEAAPDLRQEYWRPPAHQAEAARNTHAITCPECGNEFVVGARFCHVCGSEREPLVPPRHNRLARLLDFHQIRDSLGLSTPAFIAFIFGIACVVAAVTTGFIYSANTLLDWQAIQLWRIEWLLGAAAAFLAGILLKNAGR